MPGVVTGKPVNVWGTKGGAEATGYGCALTASLAASQLGMNLTGLKAVVQGFGNVGSVAARELAKRGATVVAVSDVCGGLYNSRGLDVEDLLRNRNGGLFGHDASKGDQVTNDELLELPCDILVPAALEGQIHARNAANIKARIIIEGANGPTTPEADAVLRDKGTLVVPDVLANSGGVLASYFEWVQDLHYYFWEESEVYQKLERIMSAVYGEVNAVATKHGKDLRLAAYTLAVSRVAEAHRLRGVYP